MAKPKKEEVALVKQDSNFLEYPTYVLRHTGYSKEIVIEKENGKYRLATHNPKLPDRLDRALLYYVLEKIWKNNFKSEEIRTTRYKVAKEVIGGTGKNNYARLMDGLKRWKDISVEFEGIFYEGDQRTTRYFGFLNDVILHEETNELIIRVNKQFLEQQQKTGYYRLIDWKQFKNFNKDISARLYEILQIRTLPWKIEFEALIEKLTLSTGYPAHIMSKLISAVNEINHKTALCINVNYYKNPEGKTIFVFDSVAKIPKIPRKRQMNLQFSLPIEELLKTPADEESSDERIDMLVARNVTKTTAHELVEKYPDRITEHVDILDYLIERKDPKVTKNPAGFLCKSIEKDYAVPKGYVSKEERIRRKEQHEQQRQEAVKQETQKRDQINTEQKMAAEIDKFIATLSPEQQKKLRQQAKQEAREQYGDTASEIEIVIDRKIREIAAREYKLDYNMQTSTITNI